MRIRVIGVGTRRGDDAAGIAVAEILARQALPAGVTVRICERPGADLLDEMDGVDAVVLVDGTRSDHPAGTVRRVRPGEIAAGPALSTHAMGVHEALGLAEALGRLPARVEIVGIEAGDAREGDLSPPVRDALPLAIATVRAVIEETASAGARGT